MKAVITFGRMNAPTIGHQLLVNKVVSLAKSERAVPMIFLSHSQDKKKNPLTYDQKIKLAKKAFGNVVIDSPARTIIEVLKTLQTKFDSVVIVVGSDRVAEFDKLVSTYNGREYSFDELIVVSAGEREPDADDVTGMSASKLRKLAADKNSNAFKKGLPTNLQKDSDEIMALLRSQMGLTESRFSSKFSKVLAFLKSNK